MQPCAHSKPVFRVPRFQYEVNTLCDIFLGKWVKLFYEVCLILYLGGLLLVAILLFISSKKKKY